MEAVLCSEMSVNIIQTARRHILEAAILHQKDGSVSSDVMKGKAIPVTGRQGP
jgi:hypothetical protein